MSTPFGTRVFQSLADAFLAGYHIFARNSDGYLLRKPTRAGWTYAIIPHAVILN